MPPLDASGKSKRVRMDSKSMERYFQMPALRDGDLSTLLPEDSAKPSSMPQGKGTKKSK